MGFRYRVLTLGADSVPVELEFCDPRVEFTYTSRSRFSPLGVVDFKFLHRVLVEASESRLWTLKSRFSGTGSRFWASTRFYALGVAYGILRVNSGHLAVRFWTSGS